MSHFIDNHYRGRYKSFFSPEPRLKTIIYQLVDNNFPLSTEQFQKEIEQIFCVVGNTELQIKYKTRYIHIQVDVDMSTNDVFNLGKRISIIEQIIIEKSKIMCDNTINRGLRESNNKIALVTIDKIEKLIDCKKDDSISKESLISILSLTIKECRADTKKLLKKLNSKSNNSKYVKKDVKKSK